MTAVIVGFIMATVIFIILFGIQATVGVYNDRVDGLEKYSYEIAQKIVDYDKLDKALRRKFKKDLNEADIKAIYNSLKCQNCGGSINYKKIQKELGFFILQCQYCKSIYYIKQSKRDN